MVGSVQQNAPLYLRDTRLEAKYDSNLGRNLCKTILAKYLPYEPHTYQLHGICPPMDSRDLLASTPTSLGKTGFLFMLMLVIQDISANETLALGKMRFLKDPAMIIVCPTKALEEDMVCLCQLSILTT